MKEKSVFDIIKKQNGERFAKAIRAYDNGIFDIPDLPQIVKYAGREAEPIMDFLISLKDIKIEEHGVYQTPIELLRLAGYDAYYADTLKKQNAISKYYEEDEKLCTFHDDSRYEKYHIINAVKHNVEDIKRENFVNPEREDEYGTSVLSIQILKTGGFISIKNRYNHHVEAPDNTFNSNPDNIIKGLSESIKHHLNVDFSSQKIQLPNNFTFMNNKIFHYNYEINNVYFGEDYYAQDGVVHELDKNQEIMLDYFVLDLKNKTIKNPAGIEDCFAEALQREIQGKKLQVIVNEAGHKCLLADGVQLLEMNKGKIVSVNLPTTKVIGDNFLRNNESLHTLNLPNLTTVGNEFLYFNESLTTLDLPNLTTAGNDLLYFNESLHTLDLPNLTTVGNNFLYFNESLTTLHMPSGVIKKYRNHLASHPNRHKLMSKVQPMSSLKEKLHQCSASASNITTPPPPRHSPLNTGHGQR